MTRCFYSANAVLPHKAYFSRSPMQLRIICLLRQKGCHMDKTIFYLMDLLNLMPTNTCAAICRGDQWIIEACNHSFRLLSQRFSSTSNFFESSASLSPGQQHSFLELLRQNGGDALVDRVCASSPAVSYTHLDVYKRQLP